MTASGPTSLPSVYVGDANEALATNHVDLHVDGRDEDRALWTKLGLGASTATANTLLRGTGAGTTAFGQVVAGDITPGTATLLKIAEVSGTGSSGVLEFSSITAVYRHLSLTVVGRSDTAAHNTLAQITFETSPTAGAYDWQRQLGTGATTVASESLGAVDYIYGGLFPGSTSTTNIYSLATYEFGEYANTSIWKPVLVHNAGLTHLATGELFTLMAAGVWESTAAISRIRLTLTAGNWTTLSRATLYGIPA